MTWASEILSEGEWVGNGVVLATEQEAEDYGLEMLYRCIYFKDVKTVISEKPANYKWENGCLARLDK